MVNFLFYTAATLTTTVGALLHAFHLKTQFYPAVVYLCTTKANLFVIGNFALFSLILFGFLIKTIFFGKLRIEEEHVLYERGWYAVTESLVALTIFRDEFDVKFVALFAFLLFMKTFHWLSKERVDFIEHSRTLGVLAHIRLLTHIVLLAVVDFNILRVAYNSLMTHGPSVILLFGFEYLILMSMVFLTFAKYILFTLSVRLGARFANKGLYLFIVELATQFFQLFTYFAFFVVVIRYYGLPLHIIHDLMVTIQTFRERLEAFRTYLRIIRNMETAFPDATPEDVQRFPRCAICFDDNNQGKKLPCGHVFHRNCLSSWLERQPRCPMCNRNVETGEVPRQPGQPAPPAAQQPNVQQQAAQQGGIQGAAQMQLMQMMQMMMMNNALVGGAGGAPLMQQQQQPAPQPPIQQPPQVQQPPQQQQQPGAPATPQPPPAVQTLAVQGQPPGQLQIPPHLTPPRTPTQHQQGGFPQSPQTPAMTSGLPQTPQSPSVLAPQHAPPPGMSNFTVRLDDGTQQTFIIPEGPAGVTSLPPHLQPLYMQHLAVVQQQQQLLRGQLQQQQQQQGGYLSAPLSPVVAMSPTTPMNQPATPLSPQFSGSLTETMSLLQQQVSSQQTQLAQQQRMIETLLSQLDNVQRPPSLHSTPSTVSRALFSTTATGASTRTATPTPDSGAATTTTSTSNADEDSAERDQGEQTTTTTTTPSLPTSTGSDSNSEAPDADEARLKRLQRFDSRSEL